LRLLSSPSTATRWFIGVTFLIAGGALGFLA